MYSAYKFKRVTKRFGRQVSFQRLSARVEDKSQRIVQQSQVLQFCRCCKASLAPKAEGRGRGTVSESKPKIPCSTHKQPRRETDKTQRIDVAGEYIKKRLFVRYNVLIFYSQVAKRFESLSYVTLYRCISGRSRRLYERDEGLGVVPPAGVQGQTVASTRVQGWGDEPCEPTVRLPD